MPICADMPLPPDAFLEVLSGGGGGPREEVEVLGQVSSKSTPVWRVKRGTHIWWSSEGRGGKGTLIGPYSRTLPRGQGPMGVPGGWAFAYERGTPVGEVIHVVQDGPAI